MIFNILHKTVINYDYAPLSGIQKLRLTPRDEINQKILDWKIDFNGCSVELETYDYQGNKIQLCKTKFKYGSEGMAMPINTIHEVCPCYINKPFKL